MDCRSIQAVRQTSPTYRGGDVPTVRGGEAVRKAAVFYDSLLAPNALDVDVPAEVFTGSTSFFY